jgi:aminopeptidase C
LKSPQIADEYLSTVAEPMDLYTIDHLLGYSQESGGQWSIKSAEEFVQKMRSIFMNAVLFNEPHKGESFIPL